MPQDSASRNAAMLLVLLYPKIRVHARGGQLQVSADPAALAGSLREFFESTSRETGVRQTKNLITRNLLPKSITVVVAIVLWVLVVLIPSAD